MVKDRCLIIARFQPLHYGHLNALKYGLTVADEIVVAVGMASQSHTPENPFTAGERLEMIRESARWANLPLDKLITITLPTLEVSRVAIHYLKLYSPFFSKVISLNPIIRRIFAEEGYAVVEPPVISRDLYRGSYVRKLMYEGREEWRELVPPPVVKIIEDVDGINRVKMLYSERIPGYHYILDYD